MLSVPNPFDITLLPDPTRPKEKTRTYRQFGAAWAETRAAPSTADETTRMALENIIRALKSGSNECGVVQ